MFRFHYWDWRKNDQRRALFEEKYLGKTYSSGVVKGELFVNWPTRCWTEHGTNEYVPICDTRIETAPLRRCPDGSACFNEIDDNWPSFEDVSKAVEIKEYDDTPYTRFVSTSSFRNYMEGFVIDQQNCDEKKLCRVEDDNGTKVAVRRKLHNSVGVIITALR